MSSPPQATTAESSNFKSMLDVALDEYKKKTGNDLPTHWLADKLRTSESVDAVLDILRDQAKAFERSDDQRLMKWIDPLVHVLYTFSGALGDGVGLAFPPAKVIFTGIGVLLAAAKDARASHGAVIDLFERIESFFKRLDVYTQISLTTKMAEVLVKIVIELLSILSIATKEVKRRRAKVFARKLLGRTDIEDALKRLDSLIQEEVQMAIAQILKVTTEVKDQVKDGADKSNVVMQQMSNDMEEVKRDVMGVKSGVEEVKWAQIEKDIHKWFSPPDPSTNYNIGCKAHYEGTAAWFFQGTIFKYWVSTGSLLWIHGKPGSGKSILCSAIIKHLISLRDAGQASLAYFYFDFRDKDKKQDFRNFVTSLLVQLSAYSSPCCKIIFRIYSTHGKGTQQPSDDVLTDCLREMISVAAPQPMYIIVDALDECPNASGMPTPREVVLDLLEGLVRLRLPNLRIGITSRPEVDIKNVLAPLASSAVSLHDEIGQKKDIFDYVSNVVSMDRMMRRWRSDQKELVVKELSYKAGGMFRWVFCQLEVLRHCLPASIRQTLDQLPKSLDETYVRVLSQIPQSNQAHAHRMLQCLLVAVRPLRVEELAELLAFEFDATQGGIPKYRAAWRLDDQTQAVLSTCSSLVTIVKHWYGQVVQFSHFSVKEFLISDRLTSPLGDFSRYQILPGPAHTILTQACLGSLLHLDDHIDEESFEGFHLARYAATHWVKHAQFDGVASRVKDGMETLFDSDKPHFAAWIKLHDVDYNWNRELLSKPNPLYYSVLCGFYDLVKHLAIKHPHHVNAISGRYQFPLIAALSEGHVEIAELLLEHGANVDVRETTGKTILFNMSSRSWPWSGNTRIDMVKFLLKHGADVNARDDTLRSPLHLAEYEGKLEVAEMLLKHNADVNSQDDDGKTPLHKLSENQFSDEGDVLDHALLLLKHGAEVNSRDKDNQTPSHLAVGKSHFKLARILLECGADANVENNNGRTLLHILSESLINDKSDVLTLVQSLLKHGLEMNRRDKDSQTPLHLAMERDQYHLARILLGKGADANAENSNGKTSLHILLESRIKDEDSVLDHALLLLKYGAKVNRRDKDNQTPLLLAMQRDRFKLAQILLEHGADANAENNHGKTPLHMLSESRIKDEGSVLNRAPLLLKHGAEVNRRDKDSRTPLLLAMERDRFKFAQILLERGADANVVNNNGKTPLRILSESRDHDEGNFVNHARLLLEHGVRVNRRHEDSNSNTPLILEILDATMENKMGETSVQQGPRGQYGPQERGVGVAQRSPKHGENQTMPSRFQSDLGPIQIAILLLDHGANLNAGNNGGETSTYQEMEDVNEHHLTPLHLASLYGWVEMVRVLLDRGATVDSEDNLGRTPLHLVTESEYCSWLDGVRIAQLLLEHGADVNAQDKNNTAPLHAASYYGRVYMVQVLLDHDAMADLEGNSGRTPLLHLVAGSRYYPAHDGVRIAKLLLEHGADVNAQVKDSMTPLHVASYYGRVDMVQVLLDHGATANSEGSLGRTPLHLVAGSRFYPVENGLRMANLLLDHGADVNAQDKDNITPLHLASYLERVDMVRLLLDHGATANSEVNLGRTLLHLVAEGKCGFGYNGICITELLLEHDADVNAQDKDNTTPLHLASYFGSVEISQVLLNRGATANSKRKLGRTSLHLAAEGNHGNGVRITDLLLEHGADVNAQDEVNKTPLHLASYCGRVDIARVLLGRGAVTDLKDNLGRTPIYLVIEGLHNFGHDGVGVAQLLLEHGTDVNAQDKHNTTPLHVASYCGSVEIARLLLDRGANASAKNALDQTPLHMVSRGAYYSEEDGVSVARLLLEHGADVNAQDKYHATPSGLASYYRRMKLAAFLLHYGGDANAKVDQGPTPCQLGLEGLRLHNEPEQYPPST